MKIRQWVASHRSLAFTATGAVVVAALVAGIAVVSTGFTAQKVLLQDASVWVSNGAEQAIGRTNTEIFELNSVVRSAGTDIDLLQSGTTVLVVDRSDSTLDIIDATTSTVSDSVPLPPNDPQVLLSGNTVSIIARQTGQFWSIPLANLAAFDAESTPALSLGADVVASIDAAGELFAYSRGAEQVYRIHPGESDQAASTTALEVPADAELSITSVDGQWAMLDAADNRLYLQDRSVDVADLLGVGTEVEDLAGTAAVAGPQLQQPSVQGDAVLLATGSGLAAVGLSSGDTTTLLADQNGIPAAPVVSGDCVYAGWSGGDAWRSCAAGTGSAAASLASLQIPASQTLLPLAGITADATPAFRVNGDRVVLNDTSGGASWAVGANAELINNWAALLPTDESTQQVDTTGDTPPQLDPVAQPPVAVDDEFGARPGRTSRLPVLLNDYDANGDVLTIDSVSEVNAALGYVDVINDRQMLQVTLADDASGVLSFRYSISDGRGGTASATVTVTVRGSEENSPPVQVRSTSAVVGSGGQVTSQVLGDWVDPDGDAFYLADASVRAPDTVSFKPEGRVVFANGNAGSPSASVALSVSDGSAVGTGSLAITVEPAAAVPIVADAFIVLAVAGQDVTISPLEHVHGGSGMLRLNSVPAKTGVNLTPSYEAGTFRFSSPNVGTHYLEYVVTDGDQSATGLVRVDVAPPATTGRPITIPKTVFVQTLRTARVDVAGTDIDPAGGVLVVTGVTNLDRSAGVSAEVLDQRFVQVRLDAPLEQAVTFNYRVSNGLADSEGSITVIEIPVPAALQPPVAADDEVTVRVGAAIDIPVLANDEHPDGEELTLLPTLAQELPEGAGLLFSSGTVLRYLAPAQPGNYLAVYEIAGPDGQRARAQLRISVREADADTNSSPVPGTLTARVLAGGTVVIPVPLSGIDPDGDTVLLLGQETNPEKGSVIEVGSDTITYRAGDYSTGTDTFQYAVVDAMGARATGAVRVGISARLEGARNPVATIDDVTVRPGTTVSVRVLANDSDPDGSPLTVVSAVPNDEVTTASVAGDLVVITPPAAAGVYGVVYTIENDVGGTSSNFVRVTVDPDAPPSYPVVTDTVLSLGDIVDREFVDVDVLSRVFFADGDPATLSLTIQPGFEDTAEVTRSGLIRVNIADTSQIIPFRVTHPEESGIFSYGFIWVPGLNDALPQLNRNAEPLVVTSQDTLVIPLNDYVLAVGGKQVHLTDSATVRATHTNGAELVIDGQTLAFTSADRYFGAASISFEVSDSVDSSDSSARTATLVLPITVLPRDNQPPVFDGAVLEAEPAQERQIDLTRLTTYPYPDDANELQYTVLTIPDGFTYALDGQVLTLRANESAPTGTTSSMTIGVRDGMSEGQSGRVQLTVVPSTRPLARPATDTGVVRRGQTTVIDELANDNATNPFPGSPLQVTAIRGIDSAALPEGVRVTPSADRASVTVTVAANAAPRDTTFQYQVADVTNDTNRAVWGTVRISVQDRPEPVSAVRVTDFGDRRLTVAWASGGFNNAPITGYTVNLTRAATGETISSTECSGAQCSVPTDGNGQDNAVRIAVTASNSIGASDAALAPGTAWSDIVPAAPAEVGSTPLDHGVRVVWRKPATTPGASAITKYVVSVNGVEPVEIAVPAGDAVGTQYSRNITSPGITNGSSVGFTVSARNQAVDSLAQWNSSAGSGTPAGAPTRAATPVASVSVDEAGSASLSWAGAFSANGRTVTDYYAAVFTDEAPSCTVTGDVLPGTAAVPAESAVFQHIVGGTSASFAGLTPNTTYRFAVYAFNGMGCTASTVVDATPRSRPGTVTGATFVGPETNGTNTWDFRIADLAIASGSSDIDSFVYRLSGGTVEGGQYGPRDLGSFIDTGNASQYGQAISVEIKACRRYDEFAEPLCSANWSAPRSVGVPVSQGALGGLTAELDAKPTPTPTPTNTPGGGILDPEPTEEPASGSYTWSSSPRGAYTSVTYSCGNEETVLTGGKGGTCDVVEEDSDDAGAAPRFAPLTITITVGGEQYVRTYNWNDHD